MKTTPDTLKTLVEATDEAEWPGKLIARWESASGKYYLNLYYCSKHGGCYNYEAIGAGGGIEAIHHQEAIDQAQRRVQWHQPDGNKTPMKRIF